MSYLEVQSMGIYKNSYSVKEDEVLWELHEIRHAIHKERKNRTVDEINKSAKEYFESWNAKLSQSLRNSELYNQKK